MTKVVHLTSVHSRYDTRIFHKMCKSLAKKYEVCLIVADGLGDEIKYGIRIYDVGKPISRIKRIFKTTNLIFKKALSLNADLYHFHDPELIPIGVNLKKLGKKVIYDVHEDVPRQILNKPYLKNFLKPIISKTFELYENKAAKKFDYIITATPHIRTRFQKINKKSTDINNFPIINELFEPVSWNKKSSEICYIGGITEIRGIKELIKALEYTDTILHLAGNFVPESLMEEIQEINGWNKVIYYGYIGRQEILNILKKVKIGIVTFLPVHNHINSQPNKMFEYMSAGLSVISSNFPLWKDIIEKNKCGICVNPLQPKEIAHAINFLLNNDGFAKNMGENGRKMVEQKYNWKNEEKKLLTVYEDVLSKEKII